MTTRLHYVTELESVRQNLLKMGDTTLALLSQALANVAGSEAGSAEGASELEALTDHQHRLIHDQCLNLIALQAPVARDVRFITGVLDAIVDLELIGDYAYELVVLSAATKQRAPSQIMNQLSDLGARVRATLRSAVEQWRNEDGSQPPHDRPDEAAIRADCKTLSEKLMALLASPADGTPYANLLIIVGNLERILRHSLCIAAQAAEAAPRARAD
jgi:phosphate transport system protein